MEDEDGMMRVPVLAFALRLALGSCPGVRSPLGSRSRQPRAACALSSRFFFFCGVEDPGIVFQLLDFHVSHFSECRAYFLSLLYFRFSLVFSKKLLWRCSF